VPEARVTLDADVQRVGPSHLRSFTRQLGPGTRAGVVPESLILDDSCPPEVRDMIAVVSTALEDALARAEGEWTSRTRRPILSRVRPSLRVATSEVSEMRRSWD
jgi:hypothetical protein